MYSTFRPFRSEHVPLRALNYHVCRWDASQADAAVPLVLLHGWMDVGASYQFVVDAFSHAFAAKRLIIAPDWRGFGHTRSPTPTDRYIFADYLADLDYLLDYYAPGQAVDLVGHSMGGHTAMLYAGARPERVRRLINLEGFGLPATQAAQAPARYAQWLDELKKLNRGEAALRSYDSCAGVAERLMKTNPRLSPDKALWLAQHWASPNAQGRWGVLGDPAHKIVNSQLFRVDETLAMYGAISAPTLAVNASDDSVSQLWADSFSLAEYHQRLQAVPDCRTAVVPDSGHMLHHDQPQAVAQLIEDFLAENQAK